MSHPSIHHTQHAPSAALLSSRPSPITRRRLFVSSLRSSLLKREKQKKKEKEKSAVKKNPHYFQKREKLHDGTFVSSRCQANDSPACFALVLIQQCEDSNLQETSSVLEFPMVRCLPLFCMPKEERKKKQKRSPILLLSSHLALTKRKIPGCSQLLVVLFHNLVPKCDANANNALNLVSGEACLFCLVCPKANA
jgi:hypothetical protein